MFNPPHPGDLFAEMMEERSVTEIAELIGISESTVLSLSKGEVDVTPDLSEEIAVAFGQPSRDIWYKMQRKHDAWKAEHP